MKTISKINTIIFLLIIFGGGICYFILPKKVTSLSEKRTLATLPKLTLDAYLNGSWSDSIDQYINDQSPLRYEMVNIAMSIKQYEGLHFVNEEKIVFVNIPKKDIPNPIVKIDTIAKIDTSVVKQNFLNDFNEAYSGSMLIINGSVFTLNYGGTKMSKVFSKMVSKYAKELEGSTRVFACVPPLSSAFIPVEKYKIYNSRNQQTLLAIGASLTDGAYFCDVLGELNKNADKKLFFNTDHHWTPTGAYYGYVAFCKSAGFEPVALDKMEHRIKYNFLGTLYELTRDQSVHDNPDTMEYYIPNVQTTALKYGANDLKNPSKTSVFCNGCSGGNSYSTFLCGDIPLIKIKTNVANGKKVLVIKNSYGNAFSVYLISHYEELYIVDFRYSEHNLLTLIEENNINDMIFAVGMYGAMAGGTIQRMQNLGFNNGLVKKKVKEVKDTTLIIVAESVDTTNTIK